MQPKFKIKDRVIITGSPDPEYVESYHEPEIPIVAGMKGKINLIMPNGQYHVEIQDDKGEVIAYALFHEEQLKSA
jgi:hypothetical protein